MRRAGSPPVGGKRALLAAVSGVALLGALGCSPSGSGDTSDDSSTPQASGSNSLENLDPCEMLSEAELKSFGLELPGEPTEDLPWSPGCYYSGEPISAALSKDTRNTVSSNAEKDVWAEFERIQVNGRSGARTITKGATQARICNVMFNAGDGLIQVQASEDRLPDEVDECAKGLEIAKKVEPDMPEPA
ncbi:MULTISPECIES: DUF3558 domain-containing protein [unclassified Actinopolyspora]|uniref:DUF3558 domain-containing protein n=1 Tax=unclassified Actinopolyspora TaxID=2639451 RepID=UPI0013F61F15|nr:MULTISPECIES: DUF3558 domain-containing protein [unclassified Actinopolyspora]NHD18948.1 DUF3558 domain-containing protein [Actinopolyspora sp. BKK2]NHE77371.1 DUF3558 domain-containing protein [Actinopolyspora sp. BKK1]